MLGVKWSLENGEGVYTSVDIENAISVGYKIEFINEDFPLPVFPIRNFISLVFKLKLTLLRIIFSSIFIVAFEILTIVCMKLLK